MNLLEKWNDGPLFSLGRKRAAQSTEDNAEQPQSTSLYLFVIVDVIIHFSFCTDSEDEENEEDDQPRKEIAIDPVKYLRRFVSSDTISNYLFFLSSYASNPAWLDKMILDFFDRIAKEGLIRMFHEVQCFLKLVLYLLVTMTLSLTGTDYSISTHCASRSFHTRQRRVQGAPPICQ